MAWTDIFSAGLGLANTAYNLYTNKRDFDYQKALQQQIFQREDTAVQRRMEDLQAAGLNPNLAAGSAANAGSVVSRSSTNDVNMGSALDTVQALNTIRQQKQNVKNQQVEQKILEKKEADANVENTLHRMELFNYLGLPYSVTTSLGKDGKLKLEFGLYSNDKQYEAWNNYTDMPFYKLFNYNMQNQKNSADLIQKDLDWYTADKVAGISLGLLGLGNSFKGYKSLFSK